MTAPAIVCSADTRTQPAAAEVLDAQVRAQARTAFAVGFDALVELVALRASKLYPDRFPQHAEDQATPKE